MVYNLFVCVFVCVSIKCVCFYNVYVIYNVCVCVWMWVCVSIKSVCFCNVFVFSITCVCVVSYNLCVCVFTFPADHHGAGPPGDVLL